MVLEEKNFHTGSFEEDTGTEWLETNGVGGFACGTISGCPTRKYHGLLAAPAPGQEGRTLFLHSLETSIQSTRLSVNKYPGTYHPWGYPFIETFTAFPFPRWTYTVGAYRLSKEILMPRGRQEVILRITLLSCSEPVTIQVVPYCSFRDIHSLTFANSDIRMTTEQDGGKIIVTPYHGMPSLRLAGSMKGDWSPDFFWDRNIEYDIEAVRGFDYQEDRFCPGWWKAVLEEGDTFCVQASLSEGTGEMEQLIMEEEKRRREAYALFDNGNDPLAWLKYKSEDFIIQNDRGEPSINAGYPWFGEWGRDTMIALPGLAFHCGREKTGIETLKAYAGYIVDGLLPNTLGGLQGFYSYNSIDAGLLYCRAVQEMALLGIEQSLLSTDFYPILAALLKPYLENRVPCTTLEKDGLLSAGTEETQLTWMDAKAWGKPQTPRNGKAVEINALWYNALCYFKELSGNRQHPLADAVNALIENIPSSFRTLFWLPERGYCADCVDGERKDTSIRPNMLFAAALPYSPLSSEEAKGIIETVENHLLTPYGLRTLSPDDPLFQGNYEGDGNLRDSRYHQGTVWPWLLGVYVEAALKWADQPKAKARELRALISEFLENHLYRECLGSLSEIFDGREPERGKGGFAMAWNSGELIRACSLLDKLEK